MKIKPSIYAKTLVESAGKDNEKIARLFWANLQKNKQYKDLPKIMALMDEEAATQENKKFVRIYSQTALTATEIDSATKKLVASLGSEIILKNITSKNITGVVAYFDDKIVDLSLETKIKNLKQMIAK